MAAPNNKQFKKIVKQYTAVDPMTEFSFGQQATDLFRSYKDSVGLLKYQSGQLRSQFKNQRGDIRQQGRFDLQSAAGAALERGVLGSSADVAARAQARAGTGSQVVQARDALTQALQANLAQRMSARTDYRAGMVGLAQQRMAAKSVAASQGAFEGAMDRIMAQLDKERQGRGGGGNRNNGPRNPNPNPNPNPEPTDSGHTHGSNNNGNNNGPNDREKIRRIMEQLREAQDAYGSSVQGAQAESAREAELKRQLRKIAWKPWIRRRYRKITGTGGSGNGGYGPGTNTGPGSIV